jgi:hypothetical protein
MRLRTTAFVASALAGLLYISVPSASALPAASRADITSAKTTGVTEEVRYRRRGYRRWGYRRPYYGYRPYYYGGPYYGRRYYRGWGGYPYRRRGFGVYLGF